MNHWHSIVSKGILEYGNLHLHKEVTSVSKGGENLVITHRTKPLNQIMFKPDSVFTLKDRTMLAFQILASQAKNYREVEADIFRAYLCKGISKLVFIVPTNSILENVSMRTDVIQDGLEAMGVTKNIDLFLTLLIPTDVRNQKAVLEYLTARSTTREIFQKHSV